MQYLSDLQLADRFGVNRATVWRWVQAGHFPRPVKLTEGCTRWRAADVERWEADRAGGDVA
ncbi:helix-turn-helix transcriptional regulator [Yunchengibacter salinarum]|uniref:helix-turn-helix transcriptional regulator n=1 Tax=Yunchengibacter salinarum TaxID=3133399 RepID=UPI0035B6009C